MNQLHLLSIAIILLSTASSVAQQPTWIRTNGPYGGKVTALLSVNGTLFAASGSLFRSTNGGDDWQSVGPFRMRPIGYETQPSLVLALAADSAGTVFASTRLVLYSSTDNGETWRVIAGSGTSPSNDPVALVVGTDNSVYHVVYGWLYRRAGDQSAFESAGLGVNPVTGVAVAPSGRVFAVVGAKSIYRSDDNGVSWTNVNTGGDTSIPAITNLTALTSNQLLAGTARGPICSYDGGVTWRRDTSSIRERILTSVALRDGLLYAGTEAFGAFRSSDLGATWTEITPGLDDANVWALATSDDGSLFAGTSSGVERSNDIGASWQRSSRGLNANSIADVAVDRRGNVFAASSAGVFKTINDGDDWTQANHGLTERNVSEIAIEATGSLIAITQLGTIYRSSDDGESWNRVGAIAGYDNNSALTACASGTLIVAAKSWSKGNHLLRSTDGGSTWTVVFAGPDFVAMTIASDGSIIAISTSNGGTGGTYRSTSDGASWSITKPNQYLNAIASDRNGRVYVSSGQNMWRSSDNGSTWAMHSIGQYFTMGSLAVTDGGTLVAGTRDRTLSAVISSDRGITWRNASEGLDSLTPHALVAASNGMIFGGTVEGVVRVSIAASDLPRELSIDRGPTLSRAQPNPIRGRASMRFSVTATSNVRMSLFDIRGNEIVTLYNGVATSGTHDVAIDAGQLPAGIYACRLQAGPHVVVERVIVE